MRLGKRAAAGRICDARAFADRADRRRACVEGDDRLRVSRDDLRSSVKQYLDNELGALAPQRDRPQAASVPARGAARDPPRSIVRPRRSHRRRRPRRPLLRARSYAVYFLQQQDMASLDAVTYIAHGVLGKARPRRSRARPKAPRKRARKRAARRKARSSTSLVLTLNEKAKAGKIEPPDRAHARGRPHGAGPCGPSRQTRPTSAIRESAKTAIAEGLARKIVEAHVPRGAQGRHHLRARRGRRLAHHRVDLVDEEDRFGHLLELGRRPTSAAPRSRRGSGFRRARRPCRARRWSRP